MKKTALFLIFLTLLSCFFGCDTEKKNETPSREDVFYHYGEGCLADPNADYEADIYDLGYRAENRKLRYSDDGYYGATYPFDSEVCQSSQPWHFFATYFDAIIAGDTEAYNAFFSPGYYLYAEPYERFTMQRLTNISVTRIGEYDIFAYYEVTYGIEYNDGTFRDDLPQVEDSDTVRPLYFEVNTELWLVNAILTSPEPFALDTEA